MLLLPDIVTRHEKVLGFTAQELSILFWMADQGFELISYQRTGNIHSKHQQYSNSNSKSKSIKLIPCKM